MTLFLLSRAFRTRRFLNPSSSSISSSFHYAPNPNPSPLHISPPIPVFLWPKQFYYGRRKLIVEFGAVSVRHISTSSSSSIWEKCRSIYFTATYTPTGCCIRTVRIEAFFFLESITLAATPGHLPDFKMLTLFGCGALLLRGAGCTINDLLDRDIDTMVERTKLRPVASGLLTPFQGLCFLGFQLTLGLCFLLQLNNYSRILGASSLLLVFSYPLMKRLTFWPQAFLGLTFNWGALLGWAAVKGNIDPAVVLPLYVSGVFWTLVYDTIYAHQDKEDDLKVGVKSTALRFGDSTKKWITGFGLACIGSLALSGFNAEIGWPYYASLAAASGQLAWQIWTVDLSSRADCNRKFVSNKWFGAIIFSGILFGRLSS
ncbi:4-hydroxybenzoate polyprenyltransferase, mitochondrial [Morus notabilis]|uniref:4-hydroxybenzoate polyprenyltransferase, mitochondrial n=1 Tax=Morus notabilis TaxID=981085 RepID=UPI000CED10D6|nr:4-hydroxybenzoate polyprenyltransferase, mitochondrial [Morus notabilis]